MRMLEFHLSFVVVGSPLLTLRPVLPPSLFNIGSGRQSAIWDIVCFGIFESSTADVCCDMQVVSRCADNGCSSILSTDRRGYLAVALQRL